MRRVFLSGCFILLITLSFIGGTGCANIVPPQGGPKDSLPPVLLQTDPPDSTVNFSGKEINFTFDEFIDLVDTRNNIIFSPTFVENPGVSSKLGTLTIKFKDLEPNTTYVLNFGNAIVDVNEKNPLRNFSYTFSTGPFLDSLEISGKVVLAETGGIDSTLTVLLHRNLSDSAVKTQRPPYAVKLNSRGEFRFRNLPSDTFAIYALGDAGIMRIYQNKTNLFAFSNDHVLAGDADSVVLYAYREETRPASSSSLSSVPGVGRLTGADRLRFNTPSPVKELEGDYLITFPVRLRTFDSGKLRLTTDTTFNPVDYSVSLDSTRTQMFISSSWKEDTRYNLVLEKEFATDSNGRQLLKTDTVYFTTKKISEYGNLSIRLRNVDLNRNPVLQFVQNNQVILSAPIPGGTYNRRLFIPGEYSLRVLYDTNGNGKWDPGKFLPDKRQPELVFPLERAITVKPAWDNDFEIAM